MLRAEKREGTAGISVDHCRAPRVFFFFNLKVLLTLWAALVFKG